MAVLDAALKGLGVAQLPDYYVAGYIESGELVPILSTLEIRDAAVWALYPKSRHLAPKVRLLVEFIQQAFEAEAPAHKPFSYTD